MNRVPRLLPLVVLALLAGCGDPVLWARWRAERSFWHAQREVERILVQPRVARPEDYARAQAAFREITVEFPAGRWARPGAAPMVREVAEIAGRSALAIARLADLESHTDEAVEGYAKAEADWAALAPIALEAAVLRATTLDRAGRDDAALAAWEHVSRGFGLFDPVTGRLVPAQLEAVRQLAAGLESRGRPAARDSLLGTAELRLESAESGHRNGIVAGELADAMAEVRDLQGDVDGALDALRLRLSSGAALGQAERARRMLQLGERSLAVERPDSALAYARWAAAEFGGMSRLSALDLEARSLRAAREPDSALAIYALILGEFQRQEGAMAEARFQRGRVLEDVGRWMLARTEYSVLCATYPSQPRSIEAWQRVIRHHRGAGEIELARLETDHALTSLDQLISMQHDETERGRAIEGRVAVLLAAGRTRDAIRELQGLWTAVGMSAAGARLGEAAATEAVRGLRDPALARSLWQILARSAPDPGMRERAAAALGQRPA